MNITSLIAAVTLAAIKVGEKLPLKQAVSQCEQMGQVPDAEIKWLTSNGPKWGCNPAYFKDPNDKSKDTNDRKAGRLKFHLHAIVKVPEFRINCPVLFRIASVYEKYAKSYIMMLTWRDGLWMHVDARASETSSTTRDGEQSSWTAAAESHAKGTGAKNGVHIVGHSVAGGPQVVSYANVEKPTTPQEILQLPKWRAPTDAPCVERAAGSLSVAPCWLHSGEGALCADGSTVQRVPWNPAEKETRLCHSAAATGAFKYNVSILAMVSAASLPHLLQELAADAAAAASTATQPTAPPSQVAPVAASAAASPPPTSSPPPPPPPTSSSPPPPPPHPSLVWATPTLATVKGGVDNCDESYFQHDGDFQQTTHTKFDMANNSNGMGSMSPVEWDAKCTRDRQRVATAGGFGSWNEKIAVDHQNAATAGGFGSWNEKIAVDHQNAATAGGFGSWNEKITADSQRGQQHAATAGGFGSWNEKCAGDQQDAATAGGYSNFSELLANKPQRGKNKHGKNLDLGKRNLGQKKAEAQLSALNELTGDAKWETVRSEPSHAHAWGVQYYSHPSMKGRKSGPKAMEFAVANAKKRKQVPRIAEFFSPVSDKIAAPCSDSDFE